MSKNALGLGNGKSGQVLENKKIHLANVWNSWNRFTDTIHQVLKSECRNKQDDLTGYCSYVSHLLEFVSIKLLVISALPLLMYLTIFKSYLFLKETLNLPEEPHTILPIIEYSMFQCLPHQILSRFSNIPFDVLAGVPYMLHFALPVLFIAYNVIRRRRGGVPLIYQYLWCVGWVNIIAVLIQFLFPTAPPWFNDSAVYDETTGQVISSMPNEAAFQRIDAMLGIPWFKNLYGKSPLKFGSFPSLHVAWPTVIFLHKPWFSTKVGLLHVLWITWAALYSSHHYLIDALGGISVVVAVKLGMNHVWEPFSNHKNARSETKQTPSNSREFTRLNSVSKQV